jgi:hypothetical protein
MSTKQPNTKKQQKATKPKKANKKRKQVRRPQVTKQVSAPTKAAMQVVAPVPTNPNLRENVTIRAKFDQVSLELVYASWYSYMASRGLFAIGVEEDNNPNTMVDGFGFMFGGFVSAIGSGTMELTKAPAFVLDMFAALTPKDVTLLTYGKANFSWLQSPVWFNNPIINIVGGAWTPQVVVADTNAYDSLSTTPSANYNIQAYSTLLNKIGGISKCKQLRLCDTAKYNSVLSRDVSSFSRVYVYNGLTPSQAGGYYKDVENEVTITAPMLASFSQYYADQGVEARVPLKLHAYAGDAALSAGWSLHPTFVSYFNKMAPAFKCIDFDWICFTITTWMSMCVTKSITLGQWQDGASIGISFQDFRIVLRQALLNVFDTQYMVQFTGPMQYGLQENGFVPLQINGNSYGAQQFSTFLLPKLLQENLSALRARTLRNASPKGSQINCQTYFPVLGAYTLDSYPVPTYTSPNTGAFYDLFTNNPNQIGINLVNGQIGQNQFVNLNGTYYQTALSFWTEAVLKIKQVSEETTSIVGDQGPMGLGVLYATSIVKTYDSGPTVAAPSRLLRSPFLDLIGNNKRLEPPKTDGKLARTNSAKSSVGALPPATIISETQAYGTYAYPPSAEIQAFIDSLIVPVIRLDPNGTTDQLSLQMYQIEAREPCSAKGEINVNVGGGGIVTRLSRLASLCVTGVGRDQSSEYARIMELLSDHNNAGMLAGLLGGIAKSFLPPDAHGVVDVVADILPF